MILSSRNIQAVEFLAFSGPVFEVTRRSTAFWGFPGCRYWHQSKEFGSRKVATIEHSSTCFLIFWDVHMILVITDDHVEIFSYGFFTGPLRSKMIFIQLDTNFIQIIWYFKTILIVLNLKSTYLQGYLMICLPFWLYAAKVRLYSNHSYSESKFPPAKQVNLWVSYPSNDSRPKNVKWFKCDQSTFIPIPPKLSFLLQRKNKCPDEIFAGYHPGVVQGTVPENWSENASIFQRLDTIFDPIKYLKTATTRTGHGGFRTIYGGFSSWSNLTWAYSLLIGLKLD